MATSQGEKDAVVTKDGQMEATQESTDGLLSVTFFGRKIHIGSLAYLPVVVSFSLCASLLAIINKSALVVFPYPAILTALQYLSSALAVLALGAFKVLDHNPLTWEMTWQFLPAALVYYLSLFTNMNMLHHANVDTFIVFRSCTPILVALADFFFRDQPWPNLPTFGSLFVILGAAAGYVALDKEYNLTAYSWAMAYLFTITFDMVYIKHVVHHIKLNTWGLVLYNNLLAFLLFPFFWIATGEASQSNFWDRKSYDTSTWRFEVVTPVAVSCIVGLAMSFLGFACRKCISATAFTVVGVTNKFLTVIVNTLVWDRHSSPGGIGCLLLTIVGGVMYQQATVTNASSKDEKLAQEEAKALLQKAKEGGEQAKAEEKAGLIELGDASDEEGWEGTELDSPDKESMGGSQVPTKSQPAVADVEKQGEKSPRHRS